jgi:hypothetical protein
MNDTANDAFVKQAENLEATGKARYGENWPVFVSAIDRALPKTIDRGQVVKAALATEDGAASIAGAGREALLSLTTSENRAIARESEAAYVAIQQAERDAFKKARGRR